MMEFTITIITVESYQFASNVELSPKEFITLLKADPSLLIAGTSEDNTDTAILDLLEQGTIWGTDGYGFRVKYDGASNDFKKEGLFLQVTDGNNHKSTACRSDSRKHESQ